MLVLLASVLAWGGTAAPARAETFSARETHRGLLVDTPDDTRGVLVANGLFRRAGSPAFVYREGGSAVAGVWETGTSTAVVRKGLDPDAPIVGQIIPSWSDNRLRLTIAPAGAAAIRADVFEHASGGALDRADSKRIDLQGSYRSALHFTDGSDAGWLRLEVTPEGATRFQGDLPPSVPPALAAAAAAVVDGEVDFIYANVVDISPLWR